MFGGLIMKLIIQTCNTMHEHISNMQSVVVKINNINIIIFTFRRGNGG